MDEVNKLSAAIRSALVPGAESERILGLVDGAYELSRRYVHLRELKVDLRRKRAALSHLVATLEEWRTKLMAAFSNVAKLDELEPRSIIIITAKHCHVSK